MRFSNDDHIHRSMHATVIVVDGPYAQVDTARGSWPLTGVRPGRHVLHTWTAANGETTSDVDVP